MGVAPFVAASTLLISVAQRLVRKVCPNCAVPYLPTNDILERWQVQDHEKASFVEARGCTRCSYTGYRGRTGIFEVLSLNDQIKDMIIRQATAHELRNAALKSGALLTLQDDARKKICDGITTFEEAELAVSV
jgi:type IV pilus assembly protein PilB